MNYIITMFDEGRACAELREYTSDQLFCKRCFCDIFIENSFFMVVFVYFYV